MVHDTYELGVIDYGGTDGFQVMCSDHAERVAECHRCRYHGNQDNLDPRSGSSVGHYTKIMRARRAVGDNCHVFCVLDGADQGNTEQRLNERASSVNY